MSRLRPLLILAAGLLLAAILVGLVLHERQARAEGQVVALPVEGVDPRSLLSGHYVDFRLVEQMAGNELCPVTLSRSSAPAEGWVALSPKGDHWRATGQAADRKTAARLGVLTVRGSAHCDPRVNNDITLEIGISRFHASQAEAERFSRLINRWNPEQPAPAFALVSIGKDGHARLVGLSVGGERISLDW